MLQDIWKCPKRQKIRHVSHIKTHSNDYLLVASDHIVYLLTRNELDGITVVGEYEYQSGHLYASIFFNNSVVLSVDSQILQFSLMPFGLIAKKQIDEIGLSL